MFCHHNFENRDSDILIIIYNYYNEAQNPAIMKVSNKWRQIARVQVVLVKLSLLIGCFTVGKQKLNLNTSVTVMGFSFVLFDDFKEIYHGKCRLHVHIRFYCGKRHLTVVKQHSVTTATIKQFFVLFL